MKNRIFFLIAIILCISNCFSQHKSKVKLVNGVEVYILAEPLREYEILDGTSKSVQFGSYLAKGIINASISTRIYKYVKKIKKEFYKKGETLDAVMYVGGKSMHAIRFISPPTNENNRIGVIKEVKGIPFFVMSMPVDDYKVVSKIGNGLKLKSFATMGIVNNSIEADLKGFASKVQNKFRKEKISAIIYSEGKKASAIKF